MSDCAQVRRALVVHSLDGLDEISPSAKTKAWLVAADGTISSMLLDPVLDFGLPQCAAHSLASVCGGSAAENAATFMRLVQGQQGGAVLDFVLLNAAAGLWLCEKAPTLQQAVLVARQLIESGQVHSFVQRYIAALSEPTP